MSAHPSEAVADRIAAIGKALSDPIRVRMLQLLARGRSCCDLGTLVPLAGDAPDGLCICEFEAEFGMIQSRVSYHMRILREAGLVTEEARGRWMFYLLHRDALWEVLSLLQSELDLTQLTPPK